MKGPGGGGGGGLNAGIREAEEGSDWVFGGND
jgi:GT2 family glycosyltransferase